MKIDVASIGYIGPSNRVLLEVNIIVKKFYLNNQKKLPIGDTKTKEKLANR
jgi:hypothetical protein